jgi:anthranilate phosphoribosyltransferase
LYQDTDKNYTILHAVDGFDEVSMTCDVKVFSKAGEALIRIADLGFEEINESQIKGGDTVESSARVFMNVLNGEGTVPQQNVVLCNAALALQTIHSDKSFADCFYEAEESLLSKSALNSFKALIAN